MNLPFEPPLEPMLAKLVETIPSTGDFLFEPKWDGFRALVFRDGDEVFTQSRDKKPLDRYFPELAAPLRESLPERCVVDGEIILMHDGRLAFETLQQRIHPAKSRIDRLALETPAEFVAFDVMALGDEDLREQPQQKRRSVLEQILANAGPSVRLTPATNHVAVAQDWFDRFEGAGLDGVIAKPVSLTYQPKKRAMYKIKHRRTADCVVAGFRWHKKGPKTHVGSLLLGLFDDAGKLHHVGVTSSFKWAQREALANELQPWTTNALNDHPWSDWAAAEQDPQRMPGGKSRWSGSKDLSWVPLRAERVVEVRYDFMQGSRFRHATTFVRWREDKAPADCDYEQLPQPEPFDVQAIFNHAESS